MIERESRDRRGSTVRWLAGALQPRVGEHRLRLVVLTRLAIVAASAVVLAATACSGTAKKLHRGAPPATEGLAAVRALLAAIPQQANVLGAQSAPVTLQYFGDLQCPVCRRFTEGALKPLIETDVRTGKLRIEYRSLQTATRAFATFTSQQIAALAAGKQHKAWYYIELFYNRQGRENSGYVTERFLQEIATQVPGLSLSQWQSDRAAPRLADALVTDAHAANNAGLTGTPSFLIGRTGGRMENLEYSSLTDPASFITAIEQLSGADAHGLGHHA
jgi:protein-disulfide isomerase